jgi:hypothetical protein
MDSCVKSIYIYWVGLSKKKMAFDIKGLPTPIPIKNISNDQILIDQKWFDKYLIPHTEKGDIRDIAKKYFKNRLLPG